ncbi:MAG: hypothetical protein A2033_10670 [Bacteroidetes bacterium GWA2_31_9]|nr:MAG: hypothetical protein A2033_10670 [Bacteroidetes bacterium GWA2_31_9]
MIRALYLFIILTIVSCNNSNHKYDSVQSNELRIISLAPSITTELISLELEKNIVGATTFCSISAQNPELIIGNAIEVNIEKILLLKPDIVFATGLTEPSTISSLKQNGIKIHMMPKLQSYNDICEDFLKIGKLVNKEDVALKIISESNHKVDSLKKLLIGNNSKPKVYMQIGANPLFTVIPNTFMNDYITFSGCENLAFDFNQGSITRESVLTRNPDIIFIVTMGMIGDQEKQVWESYPEINATKNHKIFIIDSNLACTPTVTSFTQTLEQVIKNIYN